MDSLRELSACDEEGYVLDVASELDGSFPEIRGVQLGQVYSW